MTEIDRTKEWTLPDGRRLGYRQHVSPWTGGICWATVNLDTNEVLATESALPGHLGGEFTAGASCTPHMLTVPPGTAAEVMAVHFAPGQLAEGARGGRGGSVSTGAHGERIDPGVRPRMMTLMAALSTLERAHTSWDGITDYVVEVLPRIEGWERAAYVEAWGVVRSYVRSPEPVALTDQDVTALERAVLAAGFIIKANTETGEISVYQKGKSE